MDGIKAPRKGLKGKIPYPGFLDRLDELDY
jgi:hypothetical protein